MKNADMPAMPTPEDLDGYYRDPKACKFFMPFMGLTKREHFAGLAMQGVLSSDANLEMSPKEIATISVEQADVLLAELEKDRSKMHPDTATARRQATQDAMVNRRRNQWVYKSRGWRAYEAPYLMMRYKMARWRGLNDPDMRL